MVKHIKTVHLNRAKHEGKLDLKKRKFACEDNETIFALESGRNPNRLKNVNNGQQFTRKLSKNSVPGLRPVIEYDTQRTLQDKLGAIDWL